MPPTKTVLPLMTIALAVGLVIVLNQHGNDEVRVQVPAGGSQALDALESSSIQMPLKPDSQVLVNHPVVDDLPEAISTVHQADELKGEAALSELLPVWMLEDGEDFYFEKVSVVGELVSRCRGRYLWDDGAFMEYELTDIGPISKPKLIKSLGFNLDQENVESDDGYTAAYELEQGVLMNHEYSETAGEGCLQILVNDRFLLEVQLEGFVAEAFVDVIDNHLPLDELLSF